MFVQVLLQVVVVVTLMIAAGIALVVGRRRVARTREEWLRRSKEVTPAAVVLAAVLLFNGVARQQIPDLSWIIERNFSWVIGWNITWTIYELEGQFIVWLQSQATPALTAYFSFVYIYGYVFMLIFPVIAYFALSETRPLRELLAAYTLNYVLGLVLYTLFVAFGPRNVMPDLVTALLYDTYPRYQHLTRAVNRNTNVFPSLHTSLAVTVALLSYRTRTLYPRWYPVAVVLGVSVSISTMYLGIHWAIDVVAGIVLAWACVALASALVGRWSIAAALERWRRRASSRDAPGDDPAAETADEDPAVGAATEDGVAGVEPRDGRE